jgi:hypothetical protein
MKLGELEWQRRLINAFRFSSLTRFKIFDVVEVETPTCLTT